MTTTKTLAELLVPDNQSIMTGQIVKSARDFAETLLPGGMFGMHYKEHGRFEFQIKIPRDTKLEDLVNGEHYSIGSTENYYTVPYRSALYCALEDIRTEKNIAETIAKIPGETFEEKLAEVSDCKCCVRHSKCRPQTLNDNPKLFDKCSMYEVIASDGCKCMCRHNARTIVRASQS